MSKEHDKFKAEQEIKKAAELKAKLDLVETKPKPRWGRHPKKIGEIVCDIGVKNGYRTESVKYVLRLDGSDFIAAAFDRDEHKDDYQHLMQLIGYSVSGYGDLSRRDHAVAEAADRIASRKTAKRSR